MAPCWVCLRHSNVILTLISLLRLPRLLARVSVLLLMGMMEVTLQLVSETVLCNTDSVETHELTLTFKGLEVSELVETKLLQVELGRHVSSSLLSRKKKLLCHPFTLTYIQRRSVLVAV